MIAHGPRNNVVHPTWLGVLDLYEEWARKQGGTVLPLLWSYFSDAIDCHYNGQEGCAACGGDVANCDAWEQAQRLMLAWLMDLAR
jgi:hypothetical protein